MEAVIRDFLIVTVLVPLALGLYHHVAGKIKRNKERHIGTQDHETGKP